MDDWAQSLFDEAAFAREQTALAGVWTFLGLASDLEEDEAWITGRIGGRSVFVQRFGETLRGYENVCAHRQYPLRVGAAGRGEVICGFHHWRYDADGHAVGVPIAQDAYGCSAEALDARLRPVEVATCGALVFGRFADAAPDGLFGGDLRAFLGEGYPILAALGDLGDAPAIHSYGQPVQANWKLMVAITLDDYHMGAVHGRKVYVRREEFDYWRFGPHSVHSTGHGSSLAETAQACAEGGYRPDNYKLINIFPNLAVTLFAAGPYWYAMVQQFDAEAPNRTDWRARYFRTSLRREAESWGARLAPKVADRIVAAIIRRRAGKITDEDHLACEQLQANARNIAPPVAALSVHEERVGWFYEAWRSAQNSAHPSGIPSDPKGL